MNDIKIPLEALESGAKELDIRLTDVQLTQYSEYAAMLVYANQQINLTRITEPEDIVRLHYLDSLTCLAAHLPDMKHGAIDVGTGAGFPGLPIKLALPELNITLADSTAKKVRFVDSVISHLKLKKTTALAARAEDLGRQSLHREKYGTAYSRALARLAVVAELCLPLLRVSGTLVAQKAENIEDEIKDCEELLDGLGGESPRIKRIRIPGTDIERSIVLITKIKPTSGKYPRTFAEISRKQVENKHKKTKQL